jgi:hypothetical protein
MIGSVYCLFEGGTLDGMCVLVERTNDEWPPSRYAWYVRRGDGWTFLESKTEEKPDSLRGFKVDRYERVSSGLTTNSLNQVGVFYRYAPEE